MKEVQKVNGCENVGMGVLMGVFAAGRGIGAVTSGPVSEVLLRMKLGGNAGYGGEYGAVIVFTGLSALAGGIGWMVRRSMRCQVKVPVDDFVERSDTGSSLKKSDEIVAKQDQKYQGETVAAHDAADTEVVAGAAASLHHDHAEVEAQFDAHSQAPTDVNTSRKNPQASCCPQA